MRTAKTQRKIEYFPIIGGEIKATNDKEGITEGYLNYIGNIDFGDDRSMKGCFVKTLSDSFARKSQQGLDYLWPYLWNHDYNLIPPGGIFDADETAKGLYIKTQYNLDMQMGRELYSSFKMGTMKKQSMGYKAIQVDWVKEGGRSIRNLLEVAVMEGSAVVFPMNDLATVEVVKNRFAAKRSNFYMSRITPSSKQDPNRINFEDHLPPLARVQKDFNDEYRQRQISDWRSSFWSWFYALNASIDDAFAQGDDPLGDVQKDLNGVDDSPGAIQQFLNLVQQGIDLDYSNYLQEQSDANSYGNTYWMNNSDTPEAKAGRALSAANHATLKKATDGIAEHVKSIKSVLASAQNPKGADNPPQQKQQENQDEDAELSTLLASINIKNAFRGK